MALAVLQLLAGLLLLYLGGSWLVGASVRLALGFGVTPLAVGLTVVAFGTSAPELAVTLDAALLGVEDVAIGNVVGSNICNIALILGLSALVRPIQARSKLMRVDVPIMLGCSLLLPAVLLDGQVSRLEGLALFGAVLVYTGLNFWISARHRVVSRPIPVPEGRPERRPRAPRELLLIALGLVALAAGGSVCVRGAVSLATIFGLSHAVIGLSVVAVGTSLPELATCVVASSRSHGDVAIGNVVGSNIFNLLAVLGVTAAVHPLVRGGVGWTDIALMLAMAFALVPLLRTGLCVSRFEGGLLLACYVGYLSWRLAG